MTQRVLIHKDHHTTHHYNHSINEGGELDLPKGALYVTITNGKLTNAQLNFFGEKSTSDKPSHWVVQRAAAERVLDLVAEHDGSKPVAWAPTAADYRSTQDLLKVEIERANKLQKFKDFVHKTLDLMGVPHDIPENIHSKEGCRIGARLDWVKTWIKS